MTKFKLTSLIVLATLLFTLTACSNNNQNTTSSDMQTQTSSEETTVGESDEATDEVTLTGVRVEPLPETLSIDNITEASISVSFTGKDIHLNDGVLEVKLNVYSNEYFDMIDIGQLAVGDVIVVNGNEIVIAEIEQKDNGITINGGLTEGGCDLATTGTDGVYYESIMELGARQLLLGEITIRVSQDFEFIDNSDLDNTGKSYLAGDLIADFMDTDEIFSEYATTAAIQDGQLIGLVRNYMP